MNITIRDRYLAAMLAAAPSQSPEYLVRRAQDAAVEACKVWGHVYQGSSCQRCGALSCVHKP